MKNLPAIANFKSALFGIGFMLTVMIMVASGLIGSITLDDLIGGELVLTMWRAIKCFSSLIIFALSIWVLLRLLAKNK